MHNLYRWSRSRVGFHLQIPFRYLRQLFFGFTIIFAAFASVLLLSQLSSMNMPSFYRHYRDMNFSTISTRKVKRYKDYCVIENVLIRKMKSKKENFNRITLVVHVSNDFLDGRIIEQVEAWDGPISLSVVLPETHTAKAMLETETKLRNYSAAIEAKLSAHIIYKSDKNCTDPIGENVLQKLSRPYIYPVNVARNVARMMSSTKYILIADYEHIFSKNFERQMLIIAETAITKNPKTALIFRIFEVDKKVKILPRDKKSLKNLLKQGKAIEFHQRYVKGAHAISGLKEWLERKVPENRPSIDRIIPYQKRSWEPQFVSLTNIPLHDENFPYPIRDNTVLRWEMCRKNYTFALVNNLFMVHRGIKTGHNNIVHLKKLANKQFKKALTLFQKRMARENPTTEKMCPLPGY